MSKVVLALSVALAVLCAPVRFDSVMTIPFLVFVIIAIVAFRKAYRSLPADRKTHQGAQGDQGQP